MLEPEFRPEGILKALHKHHVKFVLIGGFAAVIHGSPYVTTDLDVVPDMSRVNLEHLSEALGKMDARVWTTDAPHGLRFAHTAESLGRARVWNLVTKYGRLDINFQPSGTTGFADLARDAVHLEILDSEVDVASLADVIRSKEAAGREKDRVVLPTLRRLLDASNRSD